MIDKKSMFSQPFRFLYLPKSWFLSSPITCLWLHPLCRKRLVKGDHEREEMDIVFIKHSIITGIIFNNPSSMNIQPTKLKGTSLPFGQLYICPFSSPSGNFQFRFSPPLRGGASVQTYRKWYTIMKWVRGNGDKGDGG